MDYKRLKEIQANPNPSLKEVVEITSENFLSASRHNKEIKNSLAEVLNKINEISDRLTVLENKQSNIFQIEFDEDKGHPDESELNLEEEVALIDDEEDDS